MTMTARARTTRKGVILVAVMIVIASALFIATSLIHVMQADASLAAGSHAVEQSRALARSGLAAVVHELNAQRDVILNGQSPTLAAEYTLFEDDASIGVVRILPIAPDGGNLAAEAGKVDINTVDADALERTTFVSADVARSIIAFRDNTLRRPFQSVAELLQVPGVTPDMLYGPLEDVTPLDDAQLVQGAFDERLLATYDTGSVRGLADLVTVYSFEPALQQSGQWRINLNVEWSDELHDRLVDRFDEDLARGVKEILENDFRFENDQKFFELLVFFDEENPQQWVPYVDAFTFEPNDYLAGRLDVNTAPYEALLSLPGMQPEQAQDIVEMRDALTDDDRATVVWPALADACEPRQYIDLGGRITTRCWNWRVRIAAGTVPIDDPEGPLEQPVVYEAVIDLSAPQARIAYLRDVTHLQTASLVATNASLGEIDTGADDAFEFPETTESADSADFADGSSTRRSAENRDSSSDNSDSDDANTRDRAHSAASDDSARDRSPERGGGDGADASADESSTGPRRVGRWKPGG